MSSELIEWLLVPWEEIPRSSAYKIDRILLERKEAAATITQLQAELAEAREVPGRIVAWLRERSDKQHDKGYGREAAALSDAGDAIEARDWSKK